MACYNSCGETTSNAATTASSNTKNTNTKTYKNGSPESQNLLKKKADKMSIELTSAANGITNRHHADPVNAQGVDVASTTPLQLENNNNNDTSSIDNTETTQSTKKLSVLPLAVMVFYMVSGGPFGCESSVRAGGAFFTLLGFAVLPMVWSVQEAFITAELASAMGEAAGGAAWVAEAFGNRAGWMAGYLSWISGATDNAIYPVLFLDYLLQVLHRNDDGDEHAVHPVLRFLLIAAMSIALSYVNWLGLDVVGSMAMTICFIAMSPFIIMVIVGAFKVVPSRLLAMPDQDHVQDYIAALDESEIQGGFFPNASWAGVLWRPFLNNLFWNLNSFDSAASFAADIDGDPATVWPRAMSTSVFMVASCYFLPLVVALGATDNPQSAWVDGFLATIASQIVGPWLGAWTVLAAGISNLALFQAELSSDAFQLMGMADRGYVPKFLSTRSRHGTPTYGIMVGTVVIICMALADLDKLIEMLNFNYALALILEYSAFIKLRLVRPDMTRPYKIPLSTTGCVIMLVPTFVLTFIVLGLASYATYGFALLVNVAGLVIYYFRPQRNAEMYEKSSDTDSQRTSTTSSIC